MNSDAVGCMWIARRRVGHCTNRFKAFFEKIDVIYDDNKRNLITHAQCVAHAARWVHVLFAESPVRVVFVVFSCVCVYHGCMMESDVG